MAPDIFGLMTWLAISNGLGDMTLTMVKIGLDPGGVGGDPGSLGFYLEVALEK